MVDIQSSEDPDRATISSTYAFFGETADEAGDEDKEEDFEDDDED